MTVEQWKNPPSLESLKADLTNSLVTHAQQVANIREWLDYLNIEGSAKLNVPKGRSSMQPQLIRQLAEWRYAALSEPFLSTSEIFAVEPVSWEDRKAAQQNALVLNNQFETKLNKVKFFDTLIRALVTEGTGIVKLGWRYKEEERLEEVPIFDYQAIPPEMEEAFINQLQEAMQMKQTAPDSFSQLPKELIEAVARAEQGQLVMPVIVELQQLPVIKPVFNQPELHLVDAEDVIIDPTCEGDLSKVNFIIHRWQSSLAELKDSGLYDLEELEKDFVYLGLSDDDFPKIHSTNEGFFSDKPRKKFTVHEYWGYWDIDGSGLVKSIVVTWVNNTIIRMEENPYPQGELPFVVIPYLPVKNSVYGEPDGALLQNHQKLIGAISRGMIDLLGKSANSQMGSPKGLLDKANQIKFENGQNYEYNPNNLNPQNAIFQHKYPELPMSALQYMNMVSSDAEALTGVKAFSTGQGITGAGLGQTAAGVRSAMDAASKREMGILRRISNGIIEIGRKIIAMNQEFLSEEEVIRITNSEFVRVRKEDLKGYFDLRLSISTAEADEAKSQDLGFMLQTLGNNFDWGMNQLLLSEIARLKKMPDLARRIEEYQPQPSPEEQEQQRLNLELLKAQVELVKSQAQENLAKADVQHSKVGTEQAKAENLMHRTDKENLEFMHKYDGEDFKREMIQQNQKHKQNLELEALKGVLRQAEQEQKGAFDFLKQDLINDVKESTDKS